MLKLISSTIAIALIFSTAIATPNIKSNNKPLNNSLKGKTESTDNDQPSVPQMINYQGKLTDASGNPQNGNFDMTFKFFDVLTGGTQYWSETQTGVTVTNGLFNVLLGSVNSIDPATEFPSGPNCYLEITVGTQTLAPRQRIVSNGYTFFAEEADEADNAANLGGIPAAGYVVRPVQATDIADGAVTMPKINQSSATTGQVIKWTGSAWAPRNDSVGISGGPFLPLAGGIMTGAITNTGDPTITMGKGNFGSGNINSGTQAFVAGVNNRARGNYSVVSGGGGATAADSNSAIGNYSVIGGGSVNRTTDTASTIGGGRYNLASSRNSTIGGGYSNSASNWHTTIGGGYDNTASGGDATVSGGYHNIASGVDATIGGGMSNISSNNYATVGGGWYNLASGYSSIVCGGGYYNVASGSYSTVGGGGADTAAASNSFAVGSRSIVPAGASYIGSAAFNGTVATASNQLRCGTLAKTGGSFTIDHPVDPNGKILNHYFVESPDMSNIYSGLTVLDATGRAEIRLPNYFDALNRNPRIQLTGVGTYEIFVVEKVNGNRFVIGGKPGTEVFWQVTGDRKDQSAEIIRTTMPVEQPKDGALAGRMLDDDFLVGCMMQLEEMGKAGEFHFRTAEGRRRYEEMKSRLLEIERTDKK